MTTSREEKFECAIASTADEVEHLKDVKIDSLAHISDSSKSVFINARFDSQIFVKFDNIVKDVRNPFTFKDVTDKQEQYLILNPNDLLDSMYVSIIDSLNCIFFKGDDKLNYLPPTVDIGLKYSFIDLDGINVITASNVSTELYSSDLVSVKESSSKTTLFFRFMCKDLELLASKKEVLLDRYIQGKKWNYKMLTWLETSWICLITKIESQNFRKIKRNTCIQSIYKKKLKEAVECTQTISSQVKDISKLIEGNCEIQMRKLIEIFENFHKSEIYFKNCPFDKEMDSFLDLTYRKFVQLDFIRDRRLDEKLSIIDENFEKLNFIVNAFKNI